MQNKKEIYFQVKDVTRFFSITPRVLKNYESVGLLEPMRNDNSNYRLYSPEEVAKIQSIEILKKLICH